MKRFALLLTLLFLPTVAQAQQPANRIRTGPTTVGVTCRPETGDVFALSVSPYTKYECGPGRNQWRPIGETRFALLTHAHVVADIAGLQAALDAKAASSHTHTLADVTNEGTAAALNVPASGDAAAGEVVKGNDTRLTNSRAPTGGAGGVLSGSYPNPGFAVDMAEQSELDAKQPLDSDLTAIAALSPSNDDVLQRKSGAWTNRTPAQLKTDLALVKADVGLGNVDNTSDANKPVSTAQQAALDLKANLISPALTGTPTAPTAAAATNTTQVATTAHVFAERTNAATLTNKTLALGSNTVTGTLAQFNAAVTDADLARTDAAQSFSGVQSFGSALRAADGTASAPSYSFTSETNTGMTLTAGGILGFNVGGTRQMDLRSLGRVFLPVDGAGIYFGSAGGISIGHEASGGVLSVNDGLGAGKTIYSPLRVDTFGATMTVNLANGNVHEVTLTANLTSLTLSNVRAGGEYTLIIIQDGTGSRTVTWPATVKWVGGAAPTLSTGAGKIDIFRFVGRGSNVYEVSRALDVR